MKYVYVVISAVSPALLSEGNVPRAVTIVFNKRKRFKQISDINSGHVSANTGLQVPKCIAAE